MADDNLRIVAKVDDQFTGPLGRLKNELKSVGDETAKHGASWRKDWASARQEVDKFKGVLGGFTPILSGIGMGGFSAALSLGGVATALKSFSGQTRDLSNMGRQVGMTVDQLRTFGALGEKFGVSADTMRGAIGQFAVNMVDLRKRWGTVYGELRSMNLGQLAEDLVNAPNMQAATEILMKALQQIPDGMKAAFVSSLTTGSTELATVARSINGPIREAVRGVQEDIGHLNKEMEKTANDFEQHWSKIGRYMEKGKLKVLGPLLKGTVDLLDDADKNGLSGNDGERAIRDQLSPFGGPGPTDRQKLEGRREQVEQQLRLLESGPRDKDYERKHERMIEELKRVADELRRLRDAGGATAQKSSFGGNGPLGAGGGPAGGGTGSLIQQAAWGGGGMGTGSDPWAGMRARYPIPSYGSGPLGGGGGGGGGGKDGPMPSIPDNVKMTDSERNMLGLILKYESHGKNTMNYVGAGQGLDASTATGYTAQGYFQILNSNWRRLAPGLGIKARNAMAGTLEEQTRVALALLRRAGGHPKDWAPFNPALRAAIARGERVPVAAIPQVAPSGEAAVPPGDENGNFPNGAPRALKPRSMANDPSVPGQVVDDPHAATRARWDDQFARKGRAGGRAMQLPDDAPAGGKGRLDIHLHGFPEGSRAKASVDDLFDGHSISRSRPQMDLDRA